MELTVTHSAEWIADGNEERIDIAGYQAEVSPCNLPNLYSVYVYGPTAAPDKDGVVDRNFFDDTSDAKDWAEETLAALIRKGATATV